MNTSASGLSYRQEASCWHASSGKLRFGIVSNDSLPRSPCIVTTSSRRGTYSRCNKADYPAKCLLKVMIMIKSRKSHFVFTDLRVMISFKRVFLPLDAPKSCYKTKVPRKIWRDTSVSFKSKVNAELQSTCMHGALLPGWVDNKSESPNCGKL